MSIGIIAERIIIGLSLSFVLASVLTHGSAMKPCPKCGTMEVPYPLSTNDNCGNSSYGVLCNNNILQFSSAAGFRYNILSIKPQAYKLIISPPSIEKNTCYSSDLRLGGLTLDESSVFNISSRNTVMLFNCSDSILASPLNCSSNSLCRQYEMNTRASNSCGDTLCCSYLKDASMTSHRIRVRIGGCTAYTAVVELKPGSSITSWNYGVELQWLPPY